MKITYITFASLMLLTFGVINDTCVNAVYMRKPKKIKIKKPKFVKSIEKAFTGGSSNSGSAQSSALIPDTDTSIPSYLPIQGGMQFLVNNCPDSELCANWFAFYIYPPGGGTGAVTGEFGRESYLARYKDSNISVSGQRDANANTFTLEVDDVTYTGTFFASGITSSGEVMVYLELDNGLTAAPMYSSGAMRIRYGSGSSAN
eukprot:GDKI01007101.1.p1 GENE.GDKI01007101.1~~GDKI01007101.1.p1  ORF type:complete len:202 (+),score=15.13 GDKI01007101.1:172-777(+)